MSAGPKQGVYLEAALMSVRQRVNEDIDGLLRRRRRHRVIAAAAIVIATTAGGAGAAMALTASGDAPTPVAMSSRLIECTEPGTTASYFAASFAVPTSELGRIDEAAICAAARERVAADPSLATRSPAELLGLAAALIRSADSAPDADAPLTVQVATATFGGVAR